MRSLEMARDRRCESAFGSAEGKEGSGSMCGPSEADEPQSEDRARCDRDAGASCGRCGSGPSRGGARWRSGLFLLLALLAALPAPASSQAALIERTRQPLPAHARPARQVPEAGEREPPARPARAMPLPDQVGVTEEQNHEAHSKEFKLTLTFVYLTIFVIGVAGNICNCLVIADSRNRYMKTATNYYLFSLSISDLLLLIFGLPHDIVNLWQQSYLFDKFVCIARGWISEASTYASVLVIVAFTVERYLAICHPLKSYTLSRLSRSIKIIIIIWLIASTCALKVALQFGISDELPPEVESPSSSAPDGEPSGGPLNATAAATLALCSVVELDRKVFVASVIIFFIIPMTLITVLYIKLGYRLSQNSAVLKQTRLNRERNLSQRPTTVTRPLSTGGEPFSGDHSSAPAVTRTSSAEPESGAANSRAGQSTCCLGAASKHSGPARVTQASKTHEDAGRRDESRAVREVRASKRPAADERGGHSTTTNDDGDDAQTIRSEDRNETNRSKNAAAPQGSSGDDNANQPIDSRGKVAAPTLAGGRKLRHAERDLSGVGGGRRVIDKSIDADKAMSFASARAGRREMDGPGSLGRNCAAAIVGGEPAALELRQIAAAGGERRVCLQQTICESGAHRAGHSAGRPLHCRAQEGCLARTLNNGLLAGHHYRDKEAGAQQSRCSITMKIPEAFAESTAKQRHTANSAVALNSTVNTSSMKSVIKMLVSVVVMFFICWAPFHAQRLMAVYVQEPTPQERVVFDLLNNISGISYYISAVANPILYSLFSMRFRQAFRDTFGASTHLCPKFGARRGGQLIDG